MAGRKKQTFEQAMKRLEEIVQILERGDPPLEESMALFEEGTKLSVALREMLDNAEQKVSMLTQDKDGEITEMPFPAEGDTDRKSVV